MRRIVLFAVPALALGCGPEASPPPLPGVLEAFPEVHAAWLSALLEETGVEGAIYLTRVGDMSSQRVGRPMTETITREFMDSHRYWDAEIDMTDEQVFAQLVSALVLVEPGATHLQLREALRICNYAPSFRRFYVAEWNRDPVLYQESIGEPWKSRTRVYYGLDLEVNSGKASSGAWHYRWGTGPMYSGPMRVFEEEALPWTEVETIQEVIDALHARFRSDKVVSFKPANEMPVDLVLRRAQDLVDAGFLYVEVQ